jgi:hypothetical protein
VVNHNNKRNVSTVPFGKLEGNRPLRIPRHTREVSIEMDLSEAGMERVDSIKWGGGGDISLLAERTIIFSRRTLLHGVS